MLAYFRPFLPVSISSEPSSPDAVFELYEDGVLVCKFSRRTFRESLEKVCRSSNWIGSILRIFVKKFPLSLYPSKVSIFDRIGEERLVEYLRLKGFRVVKKLPISDNDIISALELKGYNVEGFLNDSYYSSARFIFDELVNKD